MTLNDYQKQAMETCTESSDNLAYMLLNLVGEVGEFSSKIAKQIRKREARIDEGRHVYTASEVDEVAEHALMMEAGDILWQLAGLCHTKGWSLEDVAAANLDKLASRKQRDVIVGDGDNR